MKTVKDPAKSHVRGVVFEEAIIIDLEEDELLSKPNSKMSLTSNSRYPIGKSPKKLIKDDADDDSEMEDKMSTLVEMFPQLTREELLDVIGATSTIDGAVAVCLLKFGDKEATGKKRKQEDSICSQDNDPVHPNKKRKQFVISEEDENDDDSDEGTEPSWDKKELMVRRLEINFPDQDKEELRMVLEEHNWNVEEALQVLQMFSDPDSNLNSLESKENKLCELKRNDQSCRDQREPEHHKYGDSTSGNKLKNAKDNEHFMKAKEDNSDETEDSENCSDSEEDKVSKSSSSLWSSKHSGATSSSSSAQMSSKLCSSSSAAQMLSRFASGTSIAKKQAAERKRKVHTSGEPISSDDEDDDDEDDEDVSSEFESDEDWSSEGVMSELKKEVLSFFQDASIDELTLISGCSVKKAQKIVELRPFHTWQSLVDVFHKNNGLSDDLVLGCRVVLRERKVVKNLMSKCETISLRMVKQVTEVMEKGIDSMKAPSILNSQFQLKTYQLIGLRWLVLLHEHKLSGILADEMGLGKTIQAIAFLAQLYQDGIGGPHLITVPSSTLDNWVRELKLWCPSLRTLVYYGSVEDRRYLRYDILREDVDFDVIVTTYNLAIGNDNDRSLFRKLPLKYAVFDEGHMLKNMNTLRYRHLMAINAEHRLLLTGTPVQNNLLELMSLLNFIMPSMFSHTTNQLSKMFSMKSYEEQSRFERDRISQAKLIMKPFILRRVKSEVLKQLPAKEEKIEFCSMSEKQQRLYETLFSKLKASSNSEKRELCNVMMQLRKMANHPLLHRQYYSTDKLQAMSKLMLKEPTHVDANAALIQEDMEVMSDFELHRLCQQYSSINSYQLENNLLLDSGKFHHLTELLASLKEKGDRVVLFSQFTMMLDIVEVLLKHLMHDYVRLDGSTPIADRIVLIDKFNNDPNIFVFLLSTRAGGLGINLTSANVVILHDIDCNPYNDKQAEDRCHRVGQSRTVRVIKLISKDSIEDCMLQLSQKKLKLEQDMTAADEGAEGTIPEDMASLLKASLGL